MEVRCLPRRSAPYLCFVLSLALAAPTALRASEIEKWLVMPGPVIAGHEKYEAECDACHARGSDAPQGLLCIECHTEVGDDIGGERGLHGRLTEAEPLECATCHTDHEGRDVNIVELDEASFDHRLTDFVLHAKHVDVACSECHQDGKPRRRAPGECVACHLDDDVHKGQMGRNCGTCHSAAGWHDADFDHATTGFALTGAHGNTECGACHVSEVFAEVGRTCVSCHASDDVHKGNNGEQCADCHTTADWKRTTFDHLAVSGFALRGGHSDLDCASCHRSHRFDDLGNSTCSTCHAGDDAHDGRFGSACGSCHNVSDWRSVAFDHAAETGFPLPPDHGELPCTACHSASLTAPVPTSCGGCHVGDDPHQGQLGDRCASCHVTWHWTAQVWFDHDITRFPLVGLHADVPCDSCHETAAFHDADAECAVCHAGDDVHEGGLGDECSDCHNPSDWHAWLFDHDTQTGFSLTGAHEELACRACHSGDGRRTASLQSDCSACHRRDDPHSGRFGNNCQACHNTRSFSQIEGM